MSNKIKLLLFTFLALLTVAYSARAFADGSINWTGQGTTNGSLNTKECDENNTSYLLWIFTLGGGQNTVTSATLFLGGSGSGTYTGTLNGNEYHITTPYFSLNTLTAYVNYTGNVGNGNSNLVISHGCPGTTPTPTNSPTPTPTVTPTPTLTPTPTVTPTPTLTPCEEDEDCETPTPTPTVTPTETPTPTPGQVIGTNDGGDGLGCAVHDCSTHPSPSNQTQAVLGASTSVLGLSNTASGDTTQKEALLFIISLSMLTAGALILRKNA